MLIQSNTYAWMSMKKSMGIKFIFNGKRICFEGCVILEYSEILFFRSTYKYRFIFSYSLKKMSTVT